MTDYLDHLIARALSGAEDVRPRPVGRFEPAPLAVGLPRAPAETAAAEPAPPPHVARATPPAPEAARVSPPPAPAPEKRPAPARPRAEAPVRSRATPAISPSEKQEQVPEQEPPALGKRPQPLSSRLPASAGALPSPAPPAERVLLAGPPPSVPPRTALQPVTREVVIARVVESEQAKREPHGGSAAGVREALLQPPTPPVLPERHAEAERAPPRPRPTDLTVPPPLIPRAEQRPDAQPPRPVVAPPEPPAHRETIGLRPTGERGFRPAIAPPVPAPQPTIQVTIGRVEVRAATPPAALPPRQREQPAVMSLDEYLRQRAGGSRP